MTKIFEKKPNNGGTPANDKSDKESTLVNKLLWCKLFNENNVVSFVFRNWRRVVNNKKDVKL